MKIEITNNLTNKNLADIKNWLTKEGDESITDLNIIEKYFNNGEMYCAISNGNVLGFLAYRKFDVWAKISIMVIHPDHRREGIGKQLVEVFLDELRSDGILVVRLQSKPSIYLPFWKSFGFLPIDTYINNTQLFLPLSAVAESDYRYKGEDEVIEIHEIDFWAGMETTPEMVFKIERDSSGKLIKPIVTTYSQELRVRWMKGNDIAYDNFMKYFPDRIKSCDLFIVTELDDEFT